MGGEGVGGGCGASRARGGAWAWASPSPLSPSLSPSLWPLLISLRVPKGPTALRAPCAAPRLAGRLAASEAWTRKESGSRSIIEVFGGSVEAQQKRFLSKCKSFPKGVSMPGGRRFGALSCFF